jgi:putative membrane protein
MFGPEVAANAPTRGARMWKPLLVAWLIIAVAIAITAAIVPSVEIDGGVVALLGVALLFGLVNALLGPVLRWLSLPLNAITFGFFAIVVNALLLLVTAGLSSSLEVGGFLAAVVAACLISLLSTLMSFGLIRVVEKQQA